MRRISNVEASAPVGRYSTGYRTRFPCSIFSVMSMYGDATPIGPEFWLPIKEAISSRISPRLSGVMLFASVSARSALIFDLISSI